MSCDPVQIASYCRSIVERGQIEGVDLRAIGSIGVRLSCPGAVWPLAGSRVYRPDIDFVGRLEQLHQVDDYLQTAGFKRLSHNMYADGAHSTYSRIVKCELELGLDVYFGRLRFNHEIPEPYFGPEKYVAYLGALILLKLAIAHPSKKDLIDLCALLHEANVLKSPDLAQYLSHACSKGRDGWCLHRTCDRNLERITSGKLLMLGYDANCSKDILQGRDWVSGSVHNGRHSIGWRLADLQARLGCKMKWFREVEPA